MVVPRDNMNGLCVSGCEEVPLFLKPHSERLMNPMSIHSSFYIHMWEGRGEDGACVHG